jgi:hypothetical protein
MGKKTHQLHSLLESKAYLVFVLRRKSLTNWKWLKDYTQGAIDIGPRSSG